MKLESYLNGRWISGDGVDEVLRNAYDGEPVAEVSSAGLDLPAAFAYGRAVGGPNLRRMTFHQRARMLKALAQFLMAHKEEIYPLSPATGATRSDSWIDIEGGIGTLFTYASKGRREADDESFYVDGGMEPLSRNGTFVGQHICVPIEGVAVHINAFNFPVWGMLEKLGPTLLAGVPALVKPASFGSWLSEKVMRLMADSGILPEGAVQMVIGKPRDLLEQLTPQDAVTFTGSAATGLMLKQKKNIVENAVRFTMEADSLNCCILGPDAVPGTEEFDLFIKEVVREMTVKAGQKCTAIRRGIVPAGMVDDVIKALGARLAKISIGDPRREDVRMGALAGRTQLKEVSARVQELRAAGELASADPDSVTILGDRERGAFMPAALLYCDRPFEHNEPHDIEAFGPVSTVMPYRTEEEAIELARRGRGSLVGSLCTYDDAFARRIVFALAPWHGRLMVLNRDCAKESTGHGSAMPHLVHGGPGRAGGGEEMGGLRGTLHYMQRVALQGSPTTLARIANRRLPGMREHEEQTHPFRRWFEELQIGETLLTHRRLVTETDVVNFAGVSGDYFYAHMDEIAAARNGFFGRRVAHGYLVIAMAAGLFVWPGEGPVLANYGMDELRFLKPVYIGDSIRVKLSCAKKTAKEKREENEPDCGVVHWAVEVYNQNGETVATYTVLTLVAKQNAGGANGING